MHRATFASIVTTAISLAALLAYLFPLAFFTCILVLTKWSRFVELLPALLWMPKSDFAQPKSCDAAQHTLMVCSYNLFLRWPLVSHGHDGDHKDIRTKLILEKIEEFDIVVIQELWEAGLSLRRQMFLREAAKRGFVHSVVPPSLQVASMCFTDSGLVILSRFPIIEASGMVFQTSCDVDALAAKGAIHALVELDNGTKVHVFNTHLQAGYAKSMPGVVDRPRAVRHEQVAELKAFVDDTTKQDNFPVVLGGDFNIDSMASGDDTEWEELLGVLKDHTSAIHPPQRTRIEYHDIKGKEPPNFCPFVCETCAKALPRMKESLCLAATDCCYDHIFIDARRGRVRIAESGVSEFPRDDTKERVFLSDHFAAHARLVFGSRGSPDG